MVTYGGKRVGLCLLSLPLDMPLLVHIVNMNFDVLGFILGKRSKPHTNEYY